MDSELLSVFRALDAARSRYLVVGGVAVVIHGHLRLTGDLDIVLQLSTDNVLATLSALRSLGYKPRVPVPAEQFADPVVRQSWIDEKGMVVFTLWSSLMPGLQIDIFVVEPFPFDETYARAERPSLDGTVVSVIGLADLIEMKRKVARPKDMEDVVALERIARIEAES